MYAKESSFHLSSPFPLPIEVWKLPKQDGLLACTCESLREKAIYQGCMVLIGWMRNPPQMEKARIVTICFDVAFFALNKFSTMFHY